MRRFMSTSRMQCKLTARLIRHAVLCLGLVSPSFAVGPTTITSVVADYTKGTFAIIRCSGTPINH